ncbi:multidrug effflux MFS transporter [Cypionkella sinensis]|uniref:Bcr/CflA family efflux transporter n=1 Tax=Cypionkella sinensis TaxID=1756043 RepID=A0ABV7J3S1_9RHOB
MQTDTPKPIVSLRLIVLLGGLAAMSALSTNILLPGFPEIARDLQASPREMGLILSSFLLAFALGQLIAGPLSDRVGRVRPVLWGLALFVVGSVVVSMAPTLSILLGGRVVQALGICAAAVLSRAIARDLFEGPDLARVLSLTMIAMAAAPGFSPLIGGLLVELAGWRLTVVLVAVLAVVLSASYLRLGETLPPARRQIVPLSAIFRSYAALARQTIFLRPALAAALIIGGLYAMFGASPEILMGLHGLDRLQLGLFFAATVFVVFGAGLLAPRLAGRFGALPMMRLGTGLVTAGGLAMLLGSGLAIYILGVVIFLLGMGLLNPLATAAALQPFGREAGLASGLLGFLHMMAAAGSTAAVSLTPGNAQTTLGLWLTTVGMMALLCLGKRAA